MLDSVLASLLAHRHAAAPLLIAASCPQSTRLRILSLASSNAMGPSQFLIWLKHTFNGPSLRASVPRDALRRMVSESFGGRHFCQTFT